MAIGAMQDYTYESFTSSSRTSQFHLYAAGRPTGTPLGLVVQLHGDGAGEFPTPTGGTLKLYNDVAKQYGMLMLAPRSPDATGVRTWWENSYSPVWLLALLDHVRSVYSIDSTKIWFMGFSGGAEVQTYWLLSDYSNRFGTGGNIMLGGGGAAGLVFGRQPTAAFKTTQRLHWAVGGNDLDDGEGFNAFAASQGGFDRYGTEGFTIRSREVIPGMDHFQSEWDGPRVLADQLALAYPPQGSAGPDQSVEPWQTVTLTGTGTGTWTQVSGTTQSLQISGSILTFTATPSMVEQVLVFGYGGKTAQVTVAKAKHGIVQVDKSLLPIRFGKK